MDHDGLTTPAVETCDGDFQIFSSSGTCDTVAACDAHRACVQDGDPTTCTGQTTACASVADFDCDGDTDATEYAMSCTGHPIKLSDNISLSKKSYCVNCLTNIVRQILHKLFNGISE